jgi:outer membrane biosynthesis protein TonB
MKCHKILDNAALQSVRAAAPFPAILEAVERDKIELSIYLVFKISET